MATVDGFRKAVLVVAILNLGYFGVEFAVALSIGSVSLLADSIDFLEDAAVSLLIFFAATWSLTSRSRVGSVLAFVILIPAVATAWIAIVKILEPVTPAPVPLSLAALGALAINLFSALLLARHRRTEGSLARAAWLSARNDALANVAIIIAAVMTLWISTGWIDIIVGIGIAILNADAARTVWRAARAERLDLQSAED